jgi:hypothetical protein
MLEWLKWFWHDTVWSKVIATVIVAAGSTLLATRKRWLRAFRTPSLRKTHAYPSDQSTTGATYPLKYYVELINDSRRCVAVRVSGYKPNTVTLQKFVPSTLQLMLDGNWLPTPNSTEAVALLPNQRCRAWLGIDSTKFTKADLERLEGRIGTVTLSADGKSIAFEL